MKFSCAILCNAIHVLTYFSCDCNCDCPYFDLSYPNYAEYAFKKRDFPIYHDKSENYIKKIELLRGSKQSYYEKDIY